MTKQAYHVNIYKIIFINLRAILNLQITFACFICVFLFNITYTLPEIMHNRLD